MVFPHSPWRRRHRGPGLFPDNGPLQLRDVLHGLGDHRPWDAERFQRGTEVPGERAELRGADLATLVRLLHASPVELIRATERLAEEELLVVAQAGHVHLREAWREAIVGHDALVEVIDDHGDALLAAQEFVE